MKCNSFCIFPSVPLWVCFVACCISLGKTVSLCNEVDHFLPVCFLVEHDYYSALCRFFCISNQWEVHEFTYLCWLQNQLLCWWPGVTLLSLSPGFLISPSPLIGQQDGWAEVHLSSPTQGATLRAERESVIHMMRSLCHNCSTISCSARQADYLGTE